MPYRARSKFERDMLDIFDEKLEDADDVSVTVTEVISESLEETTLSQPSQSKRIAEELITKKIDEAE